MSVANRGSTAISILKPMKNVGAFSYMRVDHSGSTAIPLLTPMKNVEAFSYMRAKPQRVSSKPNEHHRYQMAAIL